MSKVEVRCEWCRKPVLVAEAHIAELETSLIIANTTAANLHDVIRDRDKRIAELEREKQMYVNSTERLTARVKELEAELGSMKSSHVTGATIHPSLCDEYTKACAEIVRLRACLKRIECYAASTCSTRGTINKGLFRITREGLKEGE
jgi:chromosome segregation ATPase